MSNRVLVETDIPKLLETLVACSHKWEELGIALGLPSYVREQCRHDSFNDQSNITR